MAVPWHNKCGPLKSSHWSMAMQWVLYIEQNFKPYNSNDDVSIWVKHSRVTWSRKYQIFVRTNGEPD